MSMRDAWRVRSGEKRADSVERDKYHSLAPRESGGADELLRVGELLVSRFIQVRKGMERKRRLVEE